MINKRLVLLNPNYQPSKKNEEAARLASAPGIQRRMIGSQRTQRNSRLPSSGEMVFSADAASNTGTKTLISEGKKQALASLEDTNEAKN